MSRRGIWSTPPVTARCAPCRSTPHHSKSPATPSRWSRASWSSKPERPTSASPTTAGWCTRWARADASSARWCGLIERDKKSQCASHWPITAGHGCHQMGREWRFPCATLITLTCGSSTWPARIAAGSQTPQARTTCHSGHKTASAWYLHPCASKKVHRPSRLLKNSAKWDRQIDPVVLRCSQH